MSPFKVPLAAQHTPYLSELAASSWTLAASIVVALPPPCTCGMEHRGDCPGLPRPHRAPAGRQASRGKARSHLPPGREQGDRGHEHALDRQALRRSPASVLRQQTASFGWAMGVPMIGS